MHHLFSQISAKNLTDPEGHALGHARSLFLNPENGQVIAFAVGWGQGIAPMDLAQETRENIEVHNEDALMPILDFWRIEELGLAHCSILGKLVLSRSNQKLGRVCDVELSPDFRQMLKIHTAKHFLSWTWDERIFDWNDISEITPRAVILNVDAQKKAPVPEERGFQFSKEVSA